jgi:hypothetical protein
MTVSTTLQKWTALIVGSLALLVGCARNQGNSSSDFAATNTSPQTISPETMQEFETNEVKRKRKRVVNGSVPSNIVLTIAGRVVYFSPWPESCASNIPAPYTMS